MRKIILGVTITVMSFSTFTAASAQVFKFKTTCKICTTGSLFGVGQTIIDNTLQVLVDTANQSAVDNFGKVLDTKSVFLGAMANAAAGSNKGLAVDYGSNPSLFVVGGAFGVGANLGSTSISDLFSGDAFSNFDLQRDGLPELGGGVNATLNFGLSLKYFKFLPKIGPVDLKDIVLYFNVLSQDLSTYVSDASTQGKFFNIGLNAQYKFMKGKSFGFGALTWGGFDVSTGFNISSLSVAKDIPIDGLLNAPINDGSTLNDGSGNLVPYELTIGTSANALVGADVFTFTVPVELSTNVRLAWFLTFIGGLGMDFTVGAADLTAKVGGNGTVSYSPLASTKNVGGICNAGTALNAVGTDLCNNQDLAELEVTADISDSGSPNFFDVRPFFGLQLELYVVKIFMLANYSAIANTYSFNAGLRVVW